MIVKTKIFPIKNLDKILAPDPTVFDTPEPTEAQTKKSKQIVSPSELCESFVSKIESKEK